MRKYSDSIADELVRELAFIWSAHRIHNLKGKMRVFFPESKEIWQGKDYGVEIWFGPEDIHDVVEKIILLYKKGEHPQTTLFLDPVVYDVENKESKSAVGTGIGWANSLLKDDFPIKDKTIKRLSDVSIFSSVCSSNKSDSAGLKMKCFLSDPILIESNVVHPDGSSLEICQQIADLADINSDSPTLHNYMFSALKYYTNDGMVYQSPVYNELFGQQEFYTTENIRTNVVHKRRIEDAALCWNTYQRNTRIYDLYGIDAANLERNMKSKASSDIYINNVSKELSLIFESHKNHNLNGYMRLYSVPDQKSWRSAHEGQECWFNENEIDKAIIKIRAEYNVGMMPNSPLLLDPIIYKKEGDKYTPIGSSIIWCTALSIGKEQFDRQCLERLSDLGAFNGILLRSGSGESGVKVIVFLEEPYLFSPIEQDALIKSKINNFIMPPTIPGCRELFDIVNSNGDDYFSSYLLTNIEYLCGTGGFINKGMEDAFSDNSADNKQVIEKYTVKLQDVLDAFKCWDAYDRIHSLWERFGVDAAQLSKNLTYYNLCGRDFNLLNMTGSVRTENEQDFEFFVEGWIPKAAVTVVVATGGTGKSSLSHRLAIIAATDWSDDEPDPLFLGSRINKNDCKGLAVYFSGEDSPAIVGARAKMIDPDDRAQRLLVSFGDDLGKNKDGSKMVIGDFLEYLEKLPDVSMVVIDPARKFLVGDEENSEVVGNFFSAIEEYAVKKNCAMVVVHHMVKSAKPQDTRDMLDLLRGSQVFIDRPRVVIGLMRDDAYTIAGLAKNNIPPNMGTVQGERVFVRDPKHLDLFWVPGEEGVRTYTVSDEELEQIRLEAEMKEKMLDMEKDSKDES